MEMAGVLLLITSAKEILEHVTSLCQLSRESKEVKIFELFHFYTLIVFEKLDNPYPIIIYKNRYYYGIY